MTEPRTVFITQALFATFLWSASKIIMKLGLGIVPPLLLVGCIQAVAFISLLIYIRWRPPRLDRPFRPSEIYALVLLGVMGFVVAPLFSVIGLKYVAGTTAGLFAGISSILVMFLSWMMLKEYPKMWQLLGGIVAGVGAYVFLLDGKFSGTNFGIMMIILSELAYAFNIVLTRFVMRRPGDDALLVALVGSGLGAVILLPLGLLGGSWVGLGSWQIWLIIITLGLIFAFAGLWWNYALNYLRSFEASVLQNTMIIQVGLLSWIFLKELITWENLLGAIIVLAGAYLVNRELLNGYVARGD